MEARHRQKNAEKIRRSMEWDVCEEDTYGNPIQNQQRTELLPVP
jgi:hypothetical protein